MTSPELNSVHSVKILLCYILEKLNRPVTEEQLRLISEDSGVINYFYYSDALTELERLKENGIKGVKLHPDYQDFYADDEKMLPIYEKIGSLNMITVFHCGTESF